MRPRGFAFLISLIILLFAIVWGGGYWWITSSRAQAKAKAIAEQQAVEQAERQRREDEANARRAAMREEHDRQEKAMIERNRQQELRDDIERKKKAESAKKAEQKKKRAAFLNAEEQFIYDRAPELKTKPISKTALVERSRYVWFVFNERDGLFYDLPVIERLRELADERGAKTFIESQKITDEEQVMNLRLRLALIERHEVEPAKSILSKLSKDGPSGLLPIEKEFARTNKELFPKHVP